MWVIKALHPADPVIEIKGIPDESSSPSVIIQYNTVARISPPAGTDATWDFDLTMVPDAIEHASVTTNALVGGVPTVGTFGIMNSALKSPGNANTTYRQRLTNFLGQGVEAFRLVGMSVTAYQDGPALANQGTLCAAQYEVAARTYAIHNTGVAAAVPVAYLPLLRFQSSDLANYDNSQTMPNAYFSESKHGCYMPLKLTRPSHKWTSDRDMYKHCTHWTGIGGGSSWDGLSDQLFVGGNAPAAVPPYMDVIPGYIHDADARLLGDPLFYPLNTIFGGLSCRGLSKETSFALYFRVIIEARVQPGTLLAPQQHISPMFDQKAIESYFRINRELKDAYPADFNDLGKIWDAISEAANFVLPLIHPSLGPALKGVGSMARKLLGNPSGKGRNRRGSDLPPAAKQERAAASAAQALSRTPRRRRVRRQRTTPRTSTLKL